MSGNHICPLSVQDRKGWCTKPATINTRNPRLNAATAVASEGMEVLPKLG